MLTYQLQTHTFRLENDNNLSFPNNVELKIKFAPPSAFRTESSPSRTLVKGRKALITINANTGRVVAQSNPPLEPLEVILKSPSSEFILRGDNLTYSFYCESNEGLTSIISAIKWLLPKLINLEFSDPPTILYIRGIVGQTTFRWEQIPEEWKINMKTVIPDKLEEHIAKSFEALTIFNGFSNRRLAAALHYFYVGVRLNVCGESPWEFMAETILNYSKSLEILFSTSDETKDDIRRELKKIGYSNDEIEGDFIPLLILRSWVDVAHPKVALFTKDDLSVLYTYLAESENKIRDLLKLVLKQIEEDTYEIPQDKDLTLDKKGMDKLVNTMKSRLIARGVK